MDKEDVVKDGLRLRMVTRPRIIKTNLITCKVVKGKELMLGSKELWMILILFNGLVTF